MSEIDLGPCCVCETTQGVRNLLMLEKRSPVAGQGWGCFTCGLASDGATAVLCDECLRKPLKFACRGHGKGRIPIDLLEGYHLHDLSKHVELHRDPEYLHSQLHWFDESPDEGHPLCVCSWCGHLIEVRDDEFEDENGEYPSLSVRMWNGENQEARFHPTCFNQVLGLGILSLDS